MDWSNPIGSAVSGGFGIIGQLVNYGLQKKLAAQQNEYNLQMWNLQNEYNSPQAQMQRLEDAGLNKALMYGQGSTGNAGNAPQMVTPEAPQIDKHLAELAHAFNIEGIKTAIANRKKAQAEARIATNNAYVQEEETKGLEALGGASGRLRYDPNTGLYSYLMPDGDGTGDYVYNSGLSGIAYTTALKILSDNFRNNSLLVPRAGLIDESKFLTHKRAEYLMPQITMRNFEADWYDKLGYWSGPATTILKALLTVLRH